MNALAVDLMTPLPPPTEPPSVPTLPRPPRFQRSIDLAALPTAILCTRLFVASTLQRWGARFLEADAELLAVELVRHSVQACGVMDEYVRLSQLDHVNVIHLRLLGFERSIGIEVWDNATELPEVQGCDQGDDLHGLTLVDTRAKDWGSFVTSSGRVVWAELDVYERSSVGLPTRTPRPTRYPLPSTTLETSQAKDVKLMQRVLDGLGQL